MKLPPIILASASPRRAALLQQLDLEFQIVPSPATEASPEDLSAGEISQVNAYRKARAIGKRYPDSLVIGADTLVCLGAKVFGKPKDQDEALATLSELQGRTHSVVTGICLLHLRSHRQRVFVESSAVTFHPLSANRIRAYLKEVDPLDKAGAYAAQEHGELIIESVLGSFSNVVGLPIDRLREELAMWAQ